MSTNLMILGRPPGRALFNVKSRTLRPLTMAFCWWRLNVVTMAIPLIFFIFHFFEQDARTYTNSKTRYELRKDLTSGYSHTSPTLGVCKTSSVWSSNLLLQLFLHQDISKCCSRCSSHVRRCCLSVILLDLYLERLGPTIPKGKLYPQKCSCFLLKGK